MIPGEIIHDSFPRGDAHLGSELPQRFHRSLFIKFEFTAEQRRVRKVVQDDVRIGYGWQKRSPITRRARIGAGIRPPRATNSRDEKRDIAITGAVPHEHGALGLLRVRDLVQSLQARGSISRS